MIFPLRVRFGYDFTIERYIDSVNWLLICVDNISNYCESANSELGLSIEAFVFHLKVFMRWSKFHCLSFIKRSKKSLKLSKWNCWEFILSILICNSITQVLPFFSVEWRINSHFITWILVSSIWIKENMHVWERLVIINKSTFNSKSGDYDLSFALLFFWPMSSAV